VVKDGPFALEEAAGASTVLSALTMLEGAALGIALAREIRASVLEVLLTVAFPFFATTAKGRAILGLARTSLGLDGRPIGLSRW
jgi:shikimate kinase